MFSFHGKAPDGDLQRIAVQIKKKGDCVAPQFLLTNAEVFGA
jgi:hypothetical protein